MTGPALQVMLVDRATLIATAALLAAGIEPILLKGPAMVAWLYPEDPAARPYRDADLLVPPDRLGEAVDVLAPVGWQAALDGASAAEQDGHSVVLTPAAVPGCEVDVHFSLPGARGVPAVVHAALWSHRQRLPLGGVEVWGLDLTGRALVVCLHAARNGPDNPQSTEDLRRAVAALTASQWPEVLTLARQVGAVAGLARGLEIDAGGREVARALGLDGVTDVEMELRRAGAPALAYGLAELSGLPRRARLRRIGRELWPTGAFLRHWTDLSGLPPRSPAVMRLHRLSHLVAQAPPTLAAYARARRSSRR